MVVSSSNRLIDVVNSIIMDIIFSGDENRELTDEEKRLIRLGSKVRRSRRYRELRLGLRGSI